MRKLLAPMFALGVALLGGCDYYGFESPKTVTVTMSSSDPAVLKETTDKLLKRFAEYKAHSNSTIEHTVDGAKLVFTFLHGSPSPDALQTLINCQGTFLLYPSDEPTTTWATEADIAEVKLVGTNAGNALNLRLTPDAGARLLATTTAAQGRVASYAFDGIVKGHAAITAPFGERFELPVSPINTEAKYTLVCLRSGPLPARVLKVE